MRLKWEAVAVIGEKRVALTMEEIRTEIIRRRGYGRFRSFLFCRRRQVIAKVRYLRRQDFVRPISVDAGSGMVQAYDLTEAGQMALDQIQAGEPRVHVY